MTKLLLDEHPLVIIPSLAEKIGLNEAIVLQQLHYWLEKSTNVKEEKRWVYNTYGDWVKQFPFWSETTIRRTITKLEKEGYIQSGKFNKMKIDNTKWYTIDYNRVEDMNRPPVQNGQTKESDWTDEQSKMDRPITRDYTETTTENIHRVFQYWNSRKIVVHRSMNKAMKSHINARLEDYTAEELMKAVDNFKTVLDGEQYYWSHKWTLEDFMKPNNVIRFMDDSNPLDSFASSKKSASKKREVVEQYNSDSVEAGELLEIDL